MGPLSSDDWVTLSPDPLPVSEALAWVQRPSCGGVALFLGVVRDRSETLEHVTALTYEAYEGVAERRLAEVAAEARERWPELGRVALLHRLGQVDLGEPAVAVVVSAPHRAEALDAARFCIDTLKETVPVWKREHWAGGSDWASCDHPLRPRRPEGAAR